VAALVCIVFALDFFWSRAEVAPSPIVGSESFADPENPRPDDSPLPVPVEKGGQSTQTNTAGSGAPGSGEYGSSTIYPVLGTQGAFSSEPDPLAEFLPGRLGSGFPFEPFTGNTVGEYRSPWELNLEKYGLGNGNDSSASKSPADDDNDKTGVTPEPAAKKNGLLIVKDDPQGENEFASLGAACSVAANGNKIELCYDGRRVERPINLADLKVTIHSGEGYNPVVVFKPGLDDVDPVKYPRGMFTVTGGQLRLIGLAVELQVPRELPAENWSLFETRGGQDIQLQKCSLSISNATDQFLAYHEVAFFRIKPAPGSGGTMADPKLKAVPLAEIKLLDCVVRGEAEFIKAEGLQPLRLAWNNGLLVTTERFLSAAGSQESPKAGEKLEIDLRNVTVVSLAGLCRLTVDGHLAPHQLTTEIHCADSIIMLGEDAALIEQEGDREVEDFRQQLRWSGDRVFYETIDDYWRISNTDPEPIIESMTFDDWQRHWGLEDENLPSHNKVVWQKLPVGSGPLHARVPNDYLLAKSTQDKPNPASGAASDGQDAGFRADQLPQLPKPVATVDVDKPKTVDPLKPGDPLKPDDADETTDALGLSVEPTPRGASTIVE
jgi:hypothetical protein